MKDFNYYMSLPYTTVIKASAEGGFVASVKELPGCISQGDTEAEVFEMIQDAKAAWIDIALQDKDDIPEPEEDLDFSGKFNVRVPKSLHKELVMRAKNEKVSLNHLTTYLLSSGVVRKGKI